jgi:type II secretory pathway pseudopilin PulG
MKNKEIKKLILIKKNKSFTLEEVLISLFIFLIILGTIINSYSSIISSYLIIKNNLLALQNLKNALDRIYSEIKVGENFNINNNSIEFISALDCSTKTIFFSTSTQNSGIFLEENESTSNLTDNNLVNIAEFKIYATGTAGLTATYHNIFTSKLVYYSYSTKTITISLKAYNKLNRNNLNLPINIQTTIQPFNTYYGLSNCSLNP